MCGFRIESEFGIREEEGGGEKWSDACRFQYDGCHKRTKELTLQRVVRYRISNDRKSIGRCRKKKEEKFCIFRIGTNA